MGDQDPAHYSPHRDTAFVTIPPFYTPDEVRSACRAVQLTESSPHYSWGGATWLLNGYAFTWYNHVLGPNSRVPDCTNGGERLPQSATTARSFHPGGVNAATADSAVRFISESIDPSIWFALGSRAGQDVVDW